ncbi:hypothetical protein NDU88_006893 [Pleurodeles waltl]|uniref:Uncharacterized protein n=1 Tax=Pleurodeles waltl TaxID=8319 RepID=A0AAV7RMV3_PLEWA|nr:hypothetical protein NDU88_006893 [Pleurodeles waltl]
MILDRCASLRNTLDLGPEPIGEFCLWSRLLTSLVPQAVDPAAALIRSGRSTSLHLRRGGRSLHPDLRAFSFSSPPGEVTVLPALLGCSVGAGTLVSQSLISDPFFRVVAPQVSRPTVAATILDLGGHMRHSRISPQPIIQVSEYRFHHSSAVLRCWGRGLLCSLGLFEAGIWLGTVSGPKCHARRAASSAAGHAPYHNPAMG